MKLKTVVVTRAQELSHGVLSKSFGAFCAALLAAVAPAFGQSITNPSFEANVFTAAPGTINSNTAITGWSVTDTNRAGLNPAGGLNPYANNGTVPNGTNVAILMPTNVLSTTISDLTPGTVYNLKFRANSSVSSRPTMRVAIDNTDLLDVGSVLNVAALNVAAPYQYVSLIFTAAATAQTLYITNVSPWAAGTSTNTLLLDDFSIAASTSGWSIGNWSSDATSGVDSSRNYTHAYSFGTGAATTPFAINGVTFTRLAGTAPNVTGEFITQNLGSTTTDPGNVPKTSGGGSATLANQFAFGGDPAIITINNLVPGMDYVLTFFSVAWDAAGRSYGRAQTWGRGDDKLSVNQDHFGNDQGIRIVYRYTAPASGSITVSNKPFSAAIGSCHTYGFANYEANAQGAPVIGVAPANKVSVPGAMVGWATTAGGARPLSFRWLKDGVEIPNQTSRFLTLSNLTAADLAGYSVWVSNAFGMVTSSTAQVTFDPATIPNPSFEADLFTFWPGYSSSGNVPISGWTLGTPGRSGVNPIFDGQAPFANNGTIPDGSQVAFLQSTSSIRTTITNLVPNTNYTVRFRANARAVTKPNLHIGIDGQSALDTFWSNVGGTNAYRFVAFDFVASNTTALLSLTNDIAGDHTVLLDNFTIDPSTSRWSFAQWTNDASSGIDPSKLHTHAFYFGATTPNTNINGVVFRGAPGANPAVPGFLTTVGFGSVFTGDANVVTTSGSSSAGIASQFIYGGPVHVITLSGLQPGTEYVASIFGVGFDPRSTGRSATFNVGTDRMTINLDHFGNDQGLIISYRYIADASGSLVLTYTPTDSATTFHTYAVANRVSVDSAPIIGVQPRSTIAAIGTTETLIVGLAAGSLPLYYQWQLNGVDMLGETNSTLVLTNLNAYSSSNYTVIVTNFLGAVTSAVATVEVGIKLTEIFNTGVDEANQFLSGGQVDSHYRLVSSPDPFFPGPDALVMHNGAFPLLANYFTNGLFSSWISPRTNSSPGNSNGYYFYRTSFIIDTADPAHAQINGKWASDNEGIDILLNGVSLGISNNVSAAFAGFVPFTIANGFITGSNTIDFVISNGPATGPTALRVEMAGAGRPLAPAAPQIVNEPTGSTVLKNSSTALSVLVIGSGPLSYQWFFEGSPLTDETNRVLRFPSIQLSQSGNYSVTITNDVGTTNSATANLNVIAPPLVLVGPDSVAVSCSEETSFVVEYEGTQPITFQWYFKTNAIPGETGDFIVIPNVHPAQAGPYFVVLTGPGGSYTSAVATLTLNDFVAPVIHNATNLLACTASNSAPVTFAVTATDDCDPNPSLVCTPASGSVFPLGTNTVTCVATDANGNSATNAFTVTVFKAAQPPISNVNRAGGTVTFGFPTEAGCTYRVEKTDSFSPPLWSLLENIVGDGTVKIATDPDATVPMRFYRIVVQ